MDINIRDFSLFAEYELDHNGPRFSGSALNARHSNTPVYIIDTGTGKKYLNQSDSNVRIKCGMLIFATPFLQISLLAMKFFARLSDVLLCFIAPKKSSFFWQVKEISSQILRAISIPLIYIALEISAIYGLFFPQDGRRIYAAFERLAGDERFLAPCFQVNTIKHLFGGDLYDRHAF